jgi:FdhD protein
MPQPASPPPPLRKSVTRVRAAAVRNGQRSERPEQLATEEPMEIRAGGPGQEPVQVAVTMRTPGSDFELAVGFLVGEGLVHSPAEVATVRYCDLDPGEPQLYNIVTVELRERFVLEGPARNFSVTSSCGVCGKASLDQVEQACHPIAPSAPVAASVVLSLPGRLRQAQQVFDRTGGLHAAGAFRLDGSPVAVREDVGRHNALDKLVGRAFLAGELPLSDHIVMVSGRVSFELVQKAAMAGAGLICAVSAPSSLAVETAERLGMGLVGFVRDAGFNVYAHPERILFDT